MADNALLEKIGNLIDQKLEPIKKDMATKADIQRVEKARRQISGTVNRLETGQAQTNASLAQNTTMVEAVLAGQEELQKTMAREATVLTGFAKLTGKVNDHEERITELEKEAGIPHPHKH
jgi:hypothetical protein